VSLVAILDADKEGFLRSEGSLIQTCGRAARNVHGKAILYADKITGSMERAMAEMDRRREKQLAFNAEHGIVPATIRKEVREIMEGAREAISRRGGTRKVAEPAVDYAGMSPEMLLKKIVVLEKQMLRHARDLEFEDAAKIRDQIDAMRRAGFGFAETKAG